MSASIQFKNLIVILHLTKLIFLRNVELSSPSISNSRGLTILMEDPRPVHLRADTLQRDHLQVCSERMFCITCILRPLSIC